MPRPRNLELERDGQFKISFFSHNEVFSQFLLKCSKNVRYLTKVEHFPGAKQQTRVQIAEAEIKYTNITLSNGIKIQAAF
jgi:hypothetical protein